MVAEPTWVDTPTALAELMERLTQAVSAGERVAVDTEFHSEHRYTPRLMLIQLAIGPGQAALIDPLALPDLRGLGEVLNSAELIFHAPGQDLPLLAKRCGLSPSRLHDTQLLAGFCGLGHPLSLAHLCRDLLGVELTKGSTLSDWKQRPLSAGQRDYAADDVRYLHALVDRLQQELEPRVQAALQACGAERIDAALAVPPADQAWRRFGVARVLDPLSLRALVALCTWRETQARQLDQPTRQVLGDGLLVDIARRRPASLAALASNRRFPKKLLRDKGEFLIQLIEASRQDPAPELPVQDERSRARRACLDAFVAVRALETGIAANLLLPPSDREKTLAQAFHLGWREELLNPQMIDFLKGFSSISCPG